MKHSYSFDAGKSTRPATVADNVPAPSAKGDMAAGNSLGEQWQRVPIGADGEKLTADSAESTGVKWS